MKKIRTPLYRLNFRMKIMIVCLSVSLIPVITLGIFSHEQIGTLLVSREETALKETLVQESNALNYKINMYLNALNQIIWNENIRTSLSGLVHYKSNFDMYLIYRDVYDPFFSTIRSLNSGIKTITVYTDAPLYPHGTVLRPLSDIKQKAWFPGAVSGTTPFFVTDPEKHTMSLVCQMYLSYSNYTTVLHMELDYTITFQSLSRLFEQSYGILLTDGSHNTMYTYDDFTKKKHDYALAPAELRTALTDGTLKEEYVYETQTFTDYLWTLYLYRPIETVSASSGQITRVVVIIILIILAALIFISFLLSKILVRPLELLVDNMHEIENGDISVNIPYQSTDEIGHLIQSFRNMVHRLQYLIDEVLKSKILQQEYEMKALQAQINPHFLYNSLSLINGKAIMSGQDDISRMAQLLSSFYRTSLNHGKNSITVKNELENVRSYINIQFVMHSDSFDVLYDIEEDALPCTMINLLLQPLVENAIMHGIDHKETPGRGLLCIHCAVEGGNLVFLISDNGNGMDEEKQKRILTEETAGYGVQNVHHRIQLFYGSGYGLSYESSPGAGTAVRLTIPVSG